MFRRRRERPNSTSNTNPPVPRQVPTSGLPPNTPGVQIFGENYSGPRVLEQTDRQVTMERKSKIASIVRTVRIHKTKDPVEKLKIQLKELDRALDDAVLDQFEYEEARRTVLEEAKKAIAKKKKHASALNVEMTPSAFEKAANEELENNDEVQTLLVNNAMVSAVPLNSKSSINQANEVLIHLEDETEALLRELEETPDLQNESETAQNDEPRVVSAFVIEDIDTDNIVLGDGDFVITPAPVVALQQEEEEPTEVKQEEEEPVARASSVIFGGGVMVTVDETEETPKKSSRDEAAEMELLMMGLPAKTPKQKTTAVKPEVEPTEEALEKQQALDFAFKHENPPNRAQEVSIVKPMRVKEQAKAELPDPEEEEEKVAPVNPRFGGGGMFLGLGESNEAPTTKTTEEDELALLMMAPKAKVAVAVKKATKPVVIPVLSKPKAKLKPQKKKIMPKREAKLSYKASKQAVLSKDDEEAIAFLLSGDNPTSVVKKPSRTVVNNAMQLVAPVESDSDESDDELRYAGSAKPVFITTAHQPSLVAKKPKKKPKKAEILYPTDRLETQGPVTKVEVGQADVRANLVHGLLKGMEKEGKTAEQCLTSLKDLVRWKTITEDELELGKEILVRTKGLVL